MLYVWSEWGGWEGWRICLGATQSYLPTKGPEELPSLDPHETLPNETHTCICPFLTSAQSILMICHKRIFFKDCQFPIQGATFSTLFQLTYQKWNSLFWPSFGYARRKEEKNLQKYKLVPRNSQASISFSMYVGKINRIVSTIFKLYVSFQNIFLREILKF